MIDGLINPNAFGPRGKAHFEGAGGGHVDAGVKVYQDSLPATKRPAGTTSTKEQADYYHPETAPGWTPPNAQQMRQRLQTK